MKKKPVKRHTQIGAREHPRGRAPAGDQHSNPSKRLVSPQPTGCLVHGSAPGGAGAPATARLAYNRSLRTGRHHAGGTEAGIRIPADGVASRRGHCGWHAEGDSLSSTKMLSTQSMNVPVCGWFSSLSTQGIRARPTRTAEPQCATNSHGGQPCRYR